MRRILLALAIAATACTAPGSRHHGSTTDHGEVAVIPGELAIEWKHGLSKSEIETDERRLGLHAHFNSPELSDDELTVDEDEATPDLLGKLRSDPLVEDAEPVFEYQSLFVPNDPDFKRQWHMQQIGAESAWEWGDGAGVVVAVIDTGVAALSDMPKTSLVEGYNFVTHNKDATDDQGHGSHVAGTIAQATNNGAGVAGLAYGAKIMPIKVLDSGGSGKTTDIADGIRWAVDHGAKVINMSLGGGGYSQVMASAVRYAHDNGVVVVCAAGNSRGPVSYPAAYEGALAVSAVGFDRKLAPYSSFGPELDLAAPGGDTSIDQTKGVLQQTLGGEFKYYQGTSMASPHVAGAAALVAGAGVTRVEAIEEILLSTATPLGDAKKFGRGEVDAAAAIRQVRLFGGLWRFGIAVLLAMVAAGIVRRNKEKAASLGPLGWPLLMLASSGFLFLPLLGYGHVSSFLTTPLPEWGQMLNGANTSSLLWLSALGPFLAMGVARVPGLRGAGAAICLGFAAYLLHAAAVGWVDLAWVPGRVVEGAWLGVNGLLAFGFGTIALRAQR